MKKENHYLNLGDFKITKASIKIHRITTKFLKQNGKPGLKFLQFFRRHFSLSIINYCPFCGVGLTSQWRSYLFIWQQTSSLTKIEQVTLKEIFKTIESFQNGIKLKFMGSL